MAGELSVELKLLIYGLHVGVPCGMCGQDIPAGLPALQYFYGRPPSEGENGVAHKECWPALRDQIDKWVQSQISP